METDPESGGKLIYACFNTALQCNEAKARSICMAYAGQLHRSHVTQSGCFIWSELSWAVKCSWKHILSCPYLVIFTGSLKVKCGGAASVFELVSRIHDFMFHLWTIFLSSCFNMHTHPSGELWRQCDFYLKQVEMQVVCTVSRNLSVSTVWPGHT